MYHTNRNYGLVVGVLKLPVTIKAKHIEPYNIHSVFKINFTFNFEDRFSLCSLDCPGTLCEDQLRLDLINVYLLMSSECWT